MVQIICANTKVEEIRLWEMVDRDEEGETLEHSGQAETEGQSKTCQGVQGW